MEQAPSLTTIAPELRNSIFELALRDTDGEVEIASSGRPMKQPGLLAVCHQVRSETLPMLQHLAAKSAQRIIVRIDDFDFSPAMAYINSLSQEQRALIGNNASLKLKLMVDDSKEFNSVMAEGALQWAEYGAISLKGQLAAHVTSSAAAYEFNHHVSGHTSCILAFIAGYLSSSAKVNAHGACVAEFFGVITYKVWDSAYKAYLSLRQQNSAAS
ncbi:hypothetical protein LTR97_008830 [Elasticomyces elasticus]|uniref:Uncharacterized protein n=1 Tax=Elasticomyces elasticus TaxID=574655 RepID=A0AAN7W6B0_9PEZI|nr:hypothetical protein LTR97_008830 [Elasticomyces elasticus]KAK5714179.1 hypothetical protein LTR15_011087 [Elasticomyces elasticus]